MKKKIMACILSACLLLTVLSPVMGTIAEDTLQEVTLPVLEQVQEPAPQTENTAAPEATKVPATAAEPTAEPATQEPASEETPAAATEEPVSVTETPAPEATEEPESTEQPDGETAEPTTEPTEEPAPETPEEPQESPEATEEPAPEASEEPEESPEPEASEEPAAPLTVRLTLDRYCVFAGDNVCALAEVAGGVAPYTLTLRVFLNGACAEQTAAAAEAGAYGLNYKPENFGVHAFELLVTDAAGTVASAETSLLVAVHEGEEHPADWEKTLSSVKLTGDWRRDLVAIAETQLGYTESERNFILNANGVKQGYTRYGEWYGAAYSEWCAIFVSFCLNYADIDAASFPREAGCDSWKSRLQALGAYEDNEDEYQPGKGDLVFFNFENGGNTPTHVGIVSAASGSGIQVIEGNSNRAVRRNHYSLNDRTIVGYANMGVLMSRAGKSDEPAPTAVPSKPVELPVIPEGGVTGTTLKSEVNVRSAASTDSERVAKLADKGTEVRVLAAVDGEGQLWYQVDLGEKQGYIRGDLLALKTVEPAEQPEETAEPEAAEEPETAEPSEESTEPEAPSALNILTQPAQGGWQPGYEQMVLVFDVENAVHYGWQYALCTGAEPEWQEVPGAENPGLMLNVSMETLKYQYRCIATGADGQTAISNAVTLVAPELALWLNQQPVTEAMLARAMQADSLESVVLEDGKLVYVRTGKTVASLNGDGYLIDEETGLIVAVMDGPGNIVPVVPGSAQ
mgnify:CR=1 FL=1